MRKSRAPVHLHAHIRPRVRVRLAEYVEDPRERVVSSGCVRPREIPDFDIMEIAVSAYQLRARIYPVLEKHFCTVVTSLLHFERHVAMKKKRIDRKSVV